MMPAPHDDHDGDLEVYGAHAHTYHEAGFAPLPVPARAKTPVPEGFTGRGGAWPTEDQVQSWCMNRAWDNVALRLPPHVIGVDVDHYGDKPGGLVLTDLETKLGALPPTWRTTSRDDGVSGIRLYQVPPGLRWPGGLGPGIDTIRHEHRYAIAWPSTHPAGGTYRWIRPDGTTALYDTPRVDDLPHLPEAWVQHFTGGELAGDMPVADGSTAYTWAAKVGAGHPCPAMERAAARTITGLTTATSRHDHMLTATNRVAWLAANGHPGLDTVNAQLRSAFLAAVAGDRDAADAAAEFDRMVTGAAKLAATNPLPTGGDPCTTPLHGLVGPAAALAQLATQETTCPPSATSATTSPTSPPSSVPSPDAPSPATTAPSTSTSPATEAPSSATDAASTSATSADRPRTTWWPIDTNATLTGTEPEPDPEQLHRTDGPCAFYTGHVNGLIGPSESGKSWVAQHGAAQAVAAGQNVTIIDFEDTAAGVLNRLRALGLTDTQIAHHVAYISPDAPLAPFMPTGLDLTEHLDTWRPALVILDGFNAALSLQGLKINENDDVTAFFQQVLFPIAKTGTCLVYIDHVAKNADPSSKGGIGAQAKRALTSGCTLKVDVKKAFGKGQDGRLRLYVDKDRRGSVRGHSVPAGESNHWFADAVITSTGDDAVTVELVVPEGMDRAAGTYTFRPTVYMEKVSRYVEDNPECGRNEIVDGVTGKAEHVKTALKILVEEGWVVARRDGRKHLHTVAKPYSEAAELAGSKPPRDRGPNGVPMGSGTPVNDPVGPRSHGVSRTPWARDPGHTPDGTSMGSRSTGHLIDTETGEVLP